MTVSILLGSQGTLAILSSLSFSLLLHYLVPFKLASLPMDIRGDGARARRVKLLRHFYWKLALSHDCRRCFYLLSLFEDHPPNAFFTFIFRKSRFHECLTLLSSFTTFNPSYLSHASFRFSLSVQTRIKKKNYPT